MSAEVIATFETEVRAFAKYMAECDYIISAVKNNTEMLSGNDCYTEQISFMFTLFSESITIEVNVWIGLTHDQVVDYGAQVRTTNGTRTVNYADFDVYDRIRSFDAVERMIDTCHKEAKTKKKEVM